jgi:hypothetical protein
MLLNGPIGVEMEQPALPAQRRITKKEERSAHAQRVYAQVNSVSLTSPPPTEIDQLVPLLLSTS